MHTSVRNALLTISPSFSQAQALSCPTPDFKEQSLRHFVLFGHGSLHEHETLGFYSHFNVSATKYRSTRNRFHFVNLSCDEQAQTTQNVDDLTAFLLRSPLTQSVPTQFQHSSSLLTALSVNALWKFDADTTTQFSEMKELQSIPADQYSTHYKTLRASVQEWIAQPDSFLLVSSSFDGEVVEFFPITSSATLRNVFPFLNEASEVLSPLDPRTFSRRKGSDKLFLSQLKPTLRTLDSEAKTTIEDPLQRWIWNRLFTPGSSLTFDVWEWLKVSDKKAVVAYVPTIQSASDTFGSLPFPNSEQAETSSSTSDHLACVRNTVRLSHSRQKGLLPSHYSPSLTRRVFILSALHSRFMTLPLSVDSLMTPLLSEDSFSTLPFVTYDQATPESLSSHFNPVPPTLATPIPRSPPSTSLLPFSFVFHPKTNATWTDWNTFSLNWPTCVNYHALSIDYETQKSFTISEWAKEKAIQHPVVTMEQTLEDNGTASALSPSPSLLFTFYVSFFDAITNKQIKPHTPTQDTNTKVRHWLDEHKAFVIGLGIVFLVVLLGGMSVAMLTMEDQTINPSINKLNREYRKNGGWDAGSIELDDDTIYNILQQVNDEMISKRKTKPSRPPPPQSSTDFAADLPVPTTTPPKGSTRKSKKKKNE
ncbi:hypothetical protein BLNAU_5666 [Blattamonas nauphoetae]|uniref:Uncharacterized protein n=1 Tax=Blattamonas nauphoetae TaxID=2049346 RepID=A0ABQ9Y6G6_9EUKA|nr:hypothetical protein BLNAU_5666 [Blattamonas nauphoetae]